MLFSELSLFNDNRTVVTTRSLILHVGVAEIPDLFQLWLIKQVCFLHSKYSGDFFFQTKHQVQISEEAGDKEPKKDVEQREWLAKQDLSKLDPEMLTPLTEEVSLSAIPRKNMISYFHGRIF